MFAPRTTRIITDRETTERHIGHRFAQAFRVATSELRHEPRFWITTYQIPAIGYKIIVGRSGVEEEFLSVVVCLLNSEWPILWRYEEDGRLTQVGGAREATHTQIEKTIEVTV